MWQVLDFGVFWIFPHCQCLTFAVNKSQSRRNVCFFSPNSLVSTKKQDTQKLHPCTKFLVDNTSFSAVRWPWGQGAIWWKQTALEPPRLLGTLPISGLIELTCSLPESCQRVLEHTSFAVPGILKTGDAVSKHLFLLAILPTVQLQPFDDLGVFRPFHWHI